MELRIRHAESAKGVVLADIPFRGDVIDKVIPTLQQWGVYALSEDIEQEKMFGQFIVTEEEAYFEVVVGADD